MSESFIKTEKIAIDHLLVEITRKYLIPSKFIVGSPPVKSNVPITQKDSNNYLLF